jgi:VanZ family protein
LNRFVRYQLPVILWILAIFALSSIPTLPQIKFPISPDKLAHMGIYFVLCLLWKRALFHQERFPLLARQAVWYAFALTVVYGTLLEVYQMLVPNRYADVYDAVANAMGAGMYAGWSVWRSARRPGGETGSPDRRQLT